MRGILESIGVPGMKVIRFVRLKSFDNPEFFLVRRGEMFYALSFSASSGISMEVIARAKQLNRVEKEFDLAVENAMRQTGVGTGTGIGFGGELEVAARKMDAKAKKHLAVFDHPIFGVNWDDVSVGASDDIADKSAQQFHDLLVRQLGDWKGSSNGLNVSKHREWKSFSKMVQDAVAKRYGAKVRLYRGIHGKQAAEILKGGPLDLRKYSSWTTSRSFANSFRSFMGDRPGASSAWVVVEKVFSSKDVALAPVVLPDYGMDPDVLMPLASDVAGDGDEIIVKVSSGKIPKGKFRIVGRTQSKRFLESIQRSSAALGEFLART